MKRLNRRAKKYLRLVARRLPLHNRVRRAYLNALYRDVMEYLKANPWSDTDALFRAFGTPEQISAAFVSEMPPRDLDALVHTRRIVLWIVGISAAVAVLLLAGTVTFLAVRNRQDMDGRIVLTTASCQRGTLL